MFYGKLQSDGFITNGKGNQFFQYIFSIEGEMLNKGVGIGETGWGTHCSAKQETKNTKDVTKQKDMVLKKLAVHLIEKPPLHKCR